MAIRMQQRRGTASQWTTANPILNAGEIGFETDTNKFKIGDGTNHWEDMDYFIDENSLGTTLGDYVETSLLAVANGVATLNASGTLETSQLPDLAQVTVHAVADQAARLALDVQVGDIAIQSDNGQTYVLASSPASTDGNWDAITVADPFPTHDTDDLTEGSTNLYFTNQRALDATAAAYDAAGSAAAITPTSLGLGDVDNTSDADKPISTATQTALDLKADLASPTFTGTVTTDDLVVDGDFTVNGTNFAASATTIVIEDNIVQLAHQNPANTVDLGIVVGYNDGTAKHAGLVKDTSASTWKLFKDVTTEPTTTVDFTEGSLDDLAVAGLTASSLTVGDVSNTEFSYLNGVTSAIQTQIDTKAPTASPTFTGTVVLPSTTSVGNVSSTEIGYLDGVTSAIQTQLDGKEATLPSQTGNSGKYLTTDGSGTLSWGTVSGYSAPTLGSTSIASGSTVTTIVGLTKIRSDVFTTLDANGYEIDLETMQIMGAF